MSRSTYKSTPLPHDAAAVEQEAERQEALAANTSHTGRIQAAMTQELANRRGELTGAFADLQRMKTSRGNQTAALAGYNRVYARIERLAGVVAEMTGKAVAVPEYDPPAILTNGTRLIGVPAFDPTAGQYRETAGKGPSGKGLPPPPIPGSAADTDWVKS